VPHPDTSGAGPLGGNQSRIWHEKETYNYTNAFAFGNSVRTNN